MKHISQAMQPVIALLNDNRPAGTRPIPTHPRKRTPMKIQITANVQDAEYRVTVYDGGPEDDDGDFAGLLREACARMLAAEGAA